MLVPSHAAVPRLVSEARRRLAPAARRRSRCDDLPTFRPSRRRCEDANERSGSPPTDRRPRQRADRGRRVGGRRTRAGDAPPIHGRRQAGGPRGLPLLGLRRRRPVAAIPGGSRRRDPPRATTARGQRPGAFHNIYINREAYEEYLRTRKFPDRRCSSWKSSGQPSGTRRGYWHRGRFEAEQIGLEAAIKDTKRPGGGKDWAYYDFDLGPEPGKISPAAAMPVDRCYTCHLHHASADNVWVQFYPVLRDLSPLDEPR